MTKKITKEEAAKIINSIKSRYPDLRQASKPITFACQYQGTYRTLVKNLGLPEDQAKDIEANYHKLYKVSTDWTARKIEEFSKQGYGIVAFGLRINAPILAKTILGIKATPHEAEAEARTLGNACGQSYGLLNNRAVIEFMERVWASPYRYVIHPICLIHDAIYLVIDDTPECIQWTNKHLVECMQWQELEELKHDKVKLNADLELMPNWATPIKLNHNESLEGIRKLRCQ